MVEDISIGDEMTTYYSASYFGEGNRECLCKSCEANGRGFYARKGKKLHIPVTPHLARQLPGRKVKVPTNYGPVDPFTPSPDPDESDDDIGSVDSNTLFTKQGACIHCKVLLEPHESKNPCKDSVAEALGRTPTTALQCGRCRRHYRLYGLAWPRRPPYHRSGGVCDANFSAALCFK